MNKIYWKRIIFTVIMLFTDLVKVEINVKQNHEDRVREILKNVHAVVTRHGASDLQVMAGGQTYYIQLLELAAGYPGQVKRIISEHEQTMNCYKIVLVPFMTEKTAELCKESGIGFCDDAGNCHIAFGPIYVSVSGKKNIHTQSRGLKSVFERSSIVSSKILRMLANQPDRAWKTEELAESVSCSLGQIAKVKKFLEKNDWVIRVEEGFKLKNLEEMLNHWAEVYNARQNDVVECYVPGNLAEIEGRLEYIRKQGGPDYWLTGFSGGNRYSPTVRYSKIHVYVVESAVEKMLHQLEGKQVESGANLSVIVPYNNCVLIDSRVIKESNVVSPLQIYLDCKSLKSRGEEMAEGVLRVIKTW